jgi:hypothetical protein
MSMRRNFDLPTGLFFTLLPILIKTDTKSLNVGCKTQVFCFSGLW